MRRVLLTTVALIAFAAVAAVAADLPRAMPAKARPLFRSVTTGPASMSASTAATAGAARTGAASAATRSVRRHGRWNRGYNWQAPAARGCSASKAISTGPTSEALRECRLPDGLPDQERLAATARGRVGYAWDRFMPYVTGGLPSATSRRISRLCGRQRHQCRLDGRWRHRRRAGWELERQGRISPRRPWPHCAAARVTCSIPTPCQLPRRRSSGGLELPLLIVA